MNKLIVVFFFLTGTIWGQNQTETLSPIFPETSLPFTLQIDIDFLLPTGIQSYASAIHEGKWLLLAGRVNGLHGFDNLGNNFPPNKQNREVFVVDPISKETWRRSLSDQSGLTQEEMDALSVTASQFFQKENTLYMVGGYGINGITGLMETKNSLTAIDIPKMMKWVKKGKPSLKKAIKQAFHPLLQVTGGALFQANDHSPWLLILGQNFQGLYRADSNGIYTRQVRPFWINEEDHHLSILGKPSKKQNQDYRRRDLNVVPVLINNKQAYVAFAGVFTISGGIYTAPITIFSDGSSYQKDPNDPTTFRQAMNHYDCPSFGLYSVKHKEMFVVLPGGISFGYFENGSFTTDSEIPFINQITTIKIDKHNNYMQYLMNREYPYIESMGTNPGNQLLFGAEAEFFPKKDIKLFSNGVIQLDALPKEPTVIGYIVGGIMSTVPNTTTRFDTTSSPYVFKVTLIPKN